MKLQDVLNEMPVRRDSDLPIIKDRFNQFYSDRAIAREFKIIGRFSNAEGSYRVLLHKDHSIAVLGQDGIEPGRKPETTGVEPLCFLDFKDGFNLGTREFDTTNALQVDLVATKKERQSRTFAMTLYFALALAGFALISDNEQYNAGAELWRRIAQSADAEGCKVLIVNRGDVVGQWDGTNFPDNQLWSENDDYKYLLFVLVKK